MFQKRHKAHCYSLLYQIYKNNGFQRLDVQEEGFSQIISNVIAELKQENLRLKLIKSRNKRFRNFKL